MRGRSFGALLRTLTLSALVFSGAGCTQFGNVETVSRSIDRGNATSLVASLEIGAGQIDVDGGADGLVSARFTTQKKRVPQVNFTTDTSAGRLDVTQSAKSGGFNLGPTTNRWAVELNDDLPINLTVTGKSARENLSLDTLTINSLDASSDSGDTSVSLNGVQNRLKTVSLRSSSGNLHLRLDGDYRAPAAIDVDSSSGEINVDLNGNWISNVTGTIKTDSGTIIVTIPKEIGVQINATTDSGFIDAEGLTNHGGDSYMNDQAASGTVQMRLDIQSSNGNITIREGG
ncbi:MAG: toast rack family protein [Nitrolancea sp.]